MTNNDLPAVYSVSEIQPVSPDALIRQVKAIEQAMDRVMQEGTHYGKIPGTNSPTLLQPGAQKIGLLFRLSASFKQEIIELPNAHREVRTVCTLTAPNGQPVGDGVGVCSTMETRYRYRGGDFESTGKPVPKEYWNSRDVNLLGGKDFVAKKIDGQYVICKKGEKKENPDIADVYNTVSKMSAKRAHVHAILVTTGASDMFTQDVDDLPEFEQPTQQTARKSPDAPKQSESGKRDWSSYKYRYHLPTNREGWDMKAIRDQLKAEGGAFRAAEYIDKRTGEKRGEPDGDNHWYTHKSYSNISEYLRPLETVDVEAVVAEIVDDIPFGY
jgi:hypothetical protein